jgi:hypothetical protein
VLKDKQITLKPLDFVLAAKIAVNRDQVFLLAELAAEFQVSLSTIHGSLVRAEASRLVSRSAGSIRAMRPAIKDFAIYGLRYAFPGLMGSSARGVPTAVGAPVLAGHFEKTDALVPVWPHPEGSVWGLELVPLHPSIPSASLRDKSLYDMLALVDAIRVGAAREREIAVNELNVSL